MTLQNSPIWFASRQRNIELPLLAFGAVFVVVAWRSLVVAGVSLPAETNRIVLQFGLTALVGHLGLRTVASRAAGVPFATSIVLAAVGLGFTLRLAPAVAQQQANWVALGVILMLATVGCHRFYARTRRYQYTAAAAAFGLLVITGVAGTTINGARLWLNLGGQLVQTTEVIKALVIVFLAGYLADAGAVLSVPKFRLGGRTYGSIRVLLPVLLAVLALIGALALLKDLGSVALLLLLAISALYLATGRKLFVFGGLGLLIVTAVLGYFAFDHARVRIDTWLDPYEDPAGAGYQTIQSSYALENGGITGTGLGLGTPDAIPAVTTDYVFSAVAEELGLVGAATVVFLYVLLLCAGLQIANGTRDPHLRLVAALPALLLALQAAVIVGGNLRLIPTTGITLPFVSYGGSSLVVNFVLVGLVLGVSEESARVTRER